MYSIYYDNIQYDLYKEKKLILQDFILFEMKADLR